jgi:tetratricopeptide (TPR) repeat protein
VGLANCWYNRRAFGCGEPCRDSAAHIVDAALRLNPANADAFVLKGQLAWDHNDFPKSKSYFDQALNIAPNNSEAMNHLASFYLNYTDSIEKALTLFANALSLDPQNSGADENLQLYRNVGWIYERADMLDEAEAFQKKALSVSHAEFKKAIYSNIGNIEVLKGNFKEALNYFDSTDNKNSTAFNVLDNWAFAQDLAGNYKVAEAAYERMLQMIKTGFSEDIQTHTFRHRYAHIIWLKGQKKEAKIQFDIALKKLLKDVNSGSRYNGQEYDIAGIYNFLGDKEKAYEWLGKMAFSEYTYKLIRVDPLFKDLLGTPRYEKIMAPHYEKVHKMQAAIKKLESNGQLMRELKN